MANLEFCDTHNMVAYLLKTERSEDTRKVQITATIDGKVRLVSEASIRRHLKLEDSGGISTFSNTEIFEQLALMGYVSNSDKLTFQKDNACSILHSKGSTVPVNSHHTPSDEAASTCVDVRHGGASTTVSSLDTGQGNVNINKTPSMPRDSPLPRVHTLESDEGNMQQNKLIDLVTKLTDRVLALETDLQQTKKIYSSAVTKLIMKVKKLEKIVKETKARRRAKIVVSDDEDATEDTSKHGRKIDAIDQDPNISLVQHYAKVQGRHEQEIEFETEGISIAETLVYIRRSASKDKGKDIQATIKADEELALRIQAEEKEKYSEAEKAKLLVDLINQRKRHFAQQRAEEKRISP
nr:hypothetical protein [Tanacetum cinerariifolium]